MGLAQALVACLLLCLSSVWSCAVEAVTAPDSEVLAHLALLACPAGFRPAALAAPRCPLGAVPPTSCAPAAYRSNRPVHWAGFLALLEGSCDARRFGGVPAKPNQGQLYCFVHYQSRQKPTQKQEQLAA